MAWFTTDWFSSYHTVRCAHKSDDVMNFIIVACRISSRLKWYKNYKNRLTLAKVIVKNKMSRFLWFSVYFILRLSCWAAFCQLIINEYCIVLYCIVLYCIVLYCILRVYFGSHVRTLLCSLFVSVLAKLVLAVIYLDHPNSCKCNVISCFFILSVACYSC